MHYLIFLFLLFKSYCVLAQSGIWLERTDMPSSRQELQSAVIDGKIYVLGGIASNISILNTLEVFNPATNTWDSAAPAPVPRHHQAMAAANGKLYLLGGYNSLAFQAEAGAWIYDPTTDIWDTITPLPIPLGAATATTFNNKIYVFGGVNNFGVQKTTFIYNPDDDSWAEGADMPTPREHLASALIDNKIYVVSGRGFTDAGIKLEVYDPSTDTWQVKADMPTARSGIAAATAAGKLFVFGGEGGRVFDENEMYDPASDTWLAMPDMPTARHGLAAGTVGDTIYLIGGAIREGFGPTTKVEAFKTDIISGIKNNHLAPQWIDHAFFNQNSDLVLKANVSKNASLILYDLQGRTLWQQQNILLPSGTTVFDLNSFEFLTEIFFLNIYDGSSRYTQSFRRNF